jgi:hypothetical protein
MAPVLTDSIEFTMKALMWRHGDLIADFVAAYFLRYCPSHNAYGERCRAAVRLRDRQPNTAAAALFLDDLF